MELRPEQLETIEWMKQRESIPPCGGILADQVGAGKTFTIAGLIKASPLWPTLILVPKSLVWQWVDVLHAADLEEFLHVVPVAKGKVDEFENPAKQFVLATHGCLVNPPEGLVDRIWGRIVVDEAHCAKNPKSITSRTLRSLKAHAKWGITATPVQNRKEDLLSIARVMQIESDDVDLIRGTFVHVGQKEPSYGPEDMALRVKSELPRLVVSTVFVPLEKELEKEAYKDANTLLTLGGSGDEKMQRMALLRCRQASTHPSIYYSSMASSKAFQKNSTEYSAKAHETREVPAVEASSKIEYLVRDVTSHPDEASVVFCEWTSEMIIIKEALQKAGAKVFSFDGKLSVQDRQDVVSRFQRASSSHRPVPVAGGTVLVAQIKCASAGLNLQVASRAYIMRPNWNPTTERQAIGRLHRFGQTRDVHVVRLVSPDTADEMVLRKQEGKLKNITSVMRDDEMERLLGNKNNV